MDLDEILQDQLLKQRARLISWGNELPGVELQKWINEWDVSEWEVPDTIALAARVESEFAAQGEKLSSDIAMYITILAQYRIAVAKFGNGEFEKALNLAFGVAHYIGVRQGEKKQSTESARAKRGDANLEEKRQLLEYYEENLLDFSDESAARVLAGTQPKRTGLKHRTLVTLISGYRKFRDACNATEAGKRMLVKAKRAKEIVTRTKPATSHELRQAEMLLDKKRENDRYRIAIFVDKREGAAVTIPERLDQQCLASFDSI